MSIMNFLIACFSYSVSKQNVTGGQRRYCNPFTDCTPDASHKIDGKLY